MSLHYWLLYQKVDDRFLSYYTHLMSTKCAFCRWNIYGCGCPNFEKKIMSSPAFGPIFGHPYTMASLSMFGFLDAAKLTMIVGELPGEITPNYHGSRVLAILTSTTSTKNRVAVETVSLFSLIFIFLA